MINVINVEVMFVNIYMNLVTPKITLSALRTKSEKSLKILLKALSKSCLSFNNELYISAIYKQ